MYTKNKLHGLKTQAELRDASNVVIASYVYRGDGKRAWKELANGTRSYFYYLGEQRTAGTNGVEASGLVLWGADGIVGSRGYNSATGVTTKSYNLYDTQGNLAQPAIASYLFSRDRAVARQTPRPSRCRRAP